MIAIWGAAGAIGRSVAAELRRRGRPFRVVGRSPGKLADLGATEVVSADVADPDGCKRAAAAAGAIVYTLGLPYTRRAFAAYPQMMRDAVLAARAAGVKRILLITNVYPYGRPRTRPVSEEHPREPSSVKGEHRKQQEDILLGAHGGALQTLSLRLPDFYGPAAELTLTHQIFDALASGKTATLLGPVDVPHEFIFTPDVGPVVCDLLERADGWGRGYNLGGPGTMTFRELAQGAAAALGTQPRIRVVGPSMQRFLGLFWPLMRELGEVSYLLADPVVLDDRALRAVLPGLTKTPYAEGLKLTAAHYRR